MNETERSLRPYQLEDAKFLSSLGAGACFNEQRTGKTPTAITACEMVGARRVLIVGPASSLYAWAEEFQKWTGRACLIYTGTKRQQELCLQSWTDGMAISYDALRPTIRAGRNAGAIYGITTRVCDAVILDEAHRIKNHTTANARGAFALCHIPYRLALTGTPANGKPEDIWSILHFLYPNTFKGYWPFIKKYFRVLEMKSADGRPYMDIRGLNADGEKLMRQVLPRIATQRKRADVMPWLPAKEDPVTIRLPLTASQKKYLDELATTWETGEVITMGVLDRLIRYRQICLDPGLLSLAGSSPKTEWILQYLRDYPDRPVLIFSKFTSYLNRLSALIKEKHGVYVGATPLKERSEYVKSFQAGLLRILLLQIDAGKESLTLDTAEAIIFTDRFPPIGDLAQAEDRFVATTVDKADKLSLVYYLVMKDSYDESIAKLITARENETAIINDFNKHMKERRSTCQL